MNQVSNHLKGLNLLRKLRHWQVERWVGADEREGGGGSRVNSTWPILYFVFHFYVFLCMFPPLLPPPLQPLASLHTSPLPPSEDLLSSENATGIRGQVDW